MRSSLTAENGVLVYRTPYNSTLVDALKQAVPSHERSWDSQRKVWLVDPKHTQTLITITAQVLGETLVVAPSLFGNRPAPEETRLLDVRYIGATKDRGNERAAFAWVNDGWNAVFPERELCRWFGVDVPENETPPAQETLTLYAVLGVHQDVTGADLKTAYRRMALQWHPDRCKEADAHERFIAIQHAYEVLSNPRARGRYDAGLRLAATVPPTQPALDPAMLRNNYRPPLRCGYVLAVGHETLRRFVVTTILAWQDIINARGQTLVTSWPVGAQTFVEDWV